MKYVQREADVVSHEKPPFFYLPFKDHYVLEFLGLTEEQVRFSHERPSIGLVLCKTADRVLVRIALTVVTRKVVD